jgi:hypothetical protein
MQYSLSRTATIMTGINVYFDYSILTVSTASAVETVKAFSLAVQADYSELRRPASRYSDP